MATPANSTGRPTLAPLWTGGRRPSCLPTTAFRAAQGPLLSPSPLSPSSIPSSAYSGSLDGAARKKDRTLVNSLGHKISPASASSPKLLTSVEGQSPLVSKLEEVSLHLADAKKSSSARSPLATQGGLSDGPTHYRSRSREDYGRITTADAFVIARSIRRPNSPADDDWNPFWEDELSKSDLPRRLTLRAVIRPKASGRQTFLIQRNFDIDELRARASANAPESASPSRAGRKPLPVPEKWLSDNRRPTTTLPSPQAERSPKITSHLRAYEKLIRDPKTVPIHTQYAISALPALATILISGHVRSGDIIYLPVPHAESWPQTVRYIYTGEGALTTAMRENIIYLGGSVR